MSVNDEFDLGSDLGLNDDLDTKLEAVPPKASKAKKKAVRSVPVVEEVEEVEEDEIPEEVPVSPKTRIIIDEVPGLNNYEVVGVNGKVYQIKRGVPVMVPREVVAVLETCLMTNVEHRKNKITGEPEEVIRHYSAIPWRRA